MSVTIEIDNPESVSHDISDFLCWWEGFKIGLKTSGIDHFMVAENGIKAALDLHLKIGDAIRNTKQPPQ